jgi:hypothetical protein
VVIELIRDITIWWRRVSARRALQFRPKRICESIREKRIWRFRDSTPRMVKRSTLFKSVLQKLLVELEITECRDFRNHPTERNISKRMRSIATGNTAVDPREPDLFEDAR